MPERCQVWIWTGHDDYEEKCGKPATHRVYHGRDPRDLACCLAHIEDAREELADELHLNSIVGIEVAEIAPGAAASHAED